HRRYEATGAVAAESAERRPGRAGVRVIDREEHAPADPAQQPHVALPPRVPGPADLDAVALLQAGQRPPAPAPLQVVVGGRAAESLVAGAGIDEHDVRPAV